MEIFSIGHSTHSREKFTEMLQSCHIQLLADVRAFPGSRKFPQFSKDHFPAWLEEEGISYKHFQKLGGRRKKSKEVNPQLNGAWQNQSFHNYADYSLTRSFQEGIDELTSAAAEYPVVYCCSERHPSRCHRLLISNWLKANGWDVYHLIDGRKGNIEIVSHELGKWGAPPEIREDGTVVYPEKT